MALRHYIFVVSVGRLPDTALAAFVGIGLMSSHVFAPVTAGLTALVVVGAAVNYRRRLEAWLMAGARPGPVHHLLSDYFQCRPLGVKRRATQ